MTEGMLGGLLGGEDERPEADVPASLDRPEAFAAAVAATAGTDAGVARKTEVFLERQAQLLETQQHILREEHATRLHLLRSQAREVDIRRLGLRLRVGFQLFIVLIATAIAIAIILMIRDALTSRRVVIEPFDAPPALAARGVTGRVVASGLLDSLSRLQDATRSSAAARDISGAWSGNIKLDLPETGVSIGEISRLLKNRLGHDVQIEGDLVETPKGGLAMTVRGNGVLPSTFAGTADELEKLTREAAEYVYAKSQPGRWAAYLSSNGRNQEAIEFCRAASASVDQATRAELLNDWANALENTGGSLLEALSLYRLALRDNPKLWRSYANLMNTDELLGREEEAWRTGKALLAAGGSRPGVVPEVDYSNWDELTWNLDAWLAAVKADAEATAGAGTQVAAAGLAAADVLMRLHDREAAELALKTTKEDANDPTVAALSHFVRGRLAADVGNHALAATELGAFQTAFADPIVYSNYPGYNCWVAPAEEAIGQHAEADALLRSAGPFVDCYRFRADILDGRGDWPGAQKAYAEAVALAPDLPAAYYSWGLALARHGDLDGAIAKFKEANTRGPHWADPLKAWADVLAKKGAKRAAAAKYADALRYAPNWPELKQASGHSI